MNNVKYKLLGLHTNLFCVDFCEILKKHKIDFRVEKYRIDNEEQRCELYEIYISNNHLNRAVALSENIDAIRMLPSDKGDVDSTSANLLIPIDFSDASVMVCEFGFDTARRLSMKPMLIHAYDNEVVSKSFNFKLKENSFISFDIDYKKQESQDMRSIAEKLMTVFSAKIRGLQNIGNIPAIDFCTAISQGAPDDVIKEYSKLFNSAMIVMNTHDAKSRHEHLVGSIAAEVIDTCRIPIFTLPENSQISNMESVKTLMCFCNYDSDDIKAIDNLMKLFDYPDIKIVLIPSKLSQQKRDDSKLASLLKILKATYPLSEFVMAETSDNAKLNQLIDASIKKYDVDALVVPNKKQRGLQRLYNPGVAHKLLFEVNIPLLAIPV